MAEDGHQLLDEDGKPTKDRPWIFRTYAGHTSAAASNALFRNNLQKGQTGLSIAFDLPTQCGYSSDHPLAVPEVGKVGVPINSIDDMEVLFRDIPVERMNTSMTINSTSMWLLALYVALARKRGVDEMLLRGTTQNDLVKEYLARGTYVFPPKHSFRLISEMYEYCLEHIPKWNAANICSYHLQEAGATPAQELAFSIANARALLRRLQKRGNLSPDQFQKCVGRVSFFVNAGIRFVEELCKMRAFVEMWQETTAEFGVTNPRYQLFRYGVQVNSLGLTERQPENNAWRILLETLAVTLSRKARCRALQLPAWNEALSLPRPWDQQWSLRLQQILAYETDLLEYPDLFDGSHVVESKVAELKESAWKQVKTIEEMGMTSAVENGYLKSELVRSMTERAGRIGRGEQKVVGVNLYEDGIQSPLMTGDDGGVFKIDPRQVQETLTSLENTKRTRDDQKAQDALRVLKSAAENGQNLMEPSIACALAKVTTGEWTDALRDVFGEYRPPTGVEGQVLDLGDEPLAIVHSKVEALAERLGRRPRILVGKPGLDGHSNGAELIAVACRHGGFDVVYGGIRLSPEEIARTAVEEDVDLIGLSILSGSHLAVVEQIHQGLEELGGGRIPLVVGGIIPETDRKTLLEGGVKRTFSPSDFRIEDLLVELANVIEETAEK